MKNKFKTFGTVTITVRPFNLFAIVFLLITTCSLQYGFSQKPAPCKENGYTFTGTAETALCEELGDVTFDLVIGQGTNVTHTSQIGFSYTGNVFIQGDLIVNNGFTFLNCVVKIAPGVTIFAETPNSPFIKYQLALDNSKLFACNGLWNGIVLDDYAHVITRNGTEIEDAEKAIRAEGTFSNKLTITQTTFNRNRIGINLESSPDATNGPVIIVFSRNRFACTAPLNGTVDEIGLAGIRTVNVPVTVNPVAEAYNNRFDGLQNGIVAEGGNTVISGRYFRFFNIKKDGIFMEEGSLMLRQSLFRNCEEKGVNINLAHNVDIHNACSFVVNTDIPPIVYPNYRMGVYIGGFAMNSNVNLNLSFSADLGGTQTPVEGVYLKGGDVGAGTNIRIYQSSFNIHARGNGIHMRGAFPPTSDIHIFGNKFLCSSTTSNIVYGVNAENGAKNNLNIYGNQFTNFPGVSRAHGIALENAIGTGNYIGDNNWNAGSGRFLNAYNSQNFIICSNTAGSLGSSTGFNFGGTNVGIDFTENKIYATGLALRIAPSSMIGPQFQKGNEWRPVIRPCLPPFDNLTCTFRAIIHAECGTPDDAFLSKFTVHTDQSVWNDNTNSYDFFSPYYPENIEPSDPVYDFFEKLPGTPTSACTSQLTGPGGGSKLEKDIADGLFQAPPENPAADWIAKSYLYKKLKDSPALVGEHPAYSTFLDNNAATNIGKFFEVKKKVGEAFGASEGIDQQSGETMDKIVSLVVDLEYTDSLLESSSDENELEALAQVKSDHLEKLRNLQIGYDGLYAVYNAGMLAKFQDAYTLLQQIVPSSQLEENESTVTGIYLQSVILQNGILTADQISKLKEIGQLCPETAGLVVSTALGLLPDCEKNSLKVCEPEVFDDIEPLSSPVADGKGLMIPPSTSRGFLLYPNPAASSFFVRMPETGEVAIFDMAGEKLFVRSIEEAGIPLEISRHLAPGVYFVEMRTDDGASLTKKLVVQAR